MKIGMNLPVMAPGLTRDDFFAWCRAIDEGPWSCLAVGDRINYPNPEITVALSAAAGVTERVRLLYNVLVLPMHDAVRVAKQVGTLDVLSGGRVDLAVGVGGREEDYRAVSADWKKGKGTKTMERQVATIRATWAGEKAWENALRPVEPAPLGDGPRILAGALFPQSIRRAANWADGIAGFSFSMAPNEVGTAFEGARMAWQAAGRDEAPYLVTGGWFSLGRAGGDGGDGEARMGEYLRRYLNFMGAGADFVIPQVKTTNAAAVKDAVARVRELGADECILAPTTWSLDELKAAEDLLF